MFVILINVVACFQLSCSSLDQQGAAQLQDKQTVYQIIIIILFKSNKNKTK